MSRAIADDGPARFTIDIVRGDDVSRSWQFYSSYAGVKGATTTVALDITGRTYASKIADTIGGTVVATPTVTVVDAANGSITWALTDTQTDALTARRYTFDLIENAGTSSERTLIIGQINMIGRVTP